MMAIASTTPPTETVNEAQAIQEIVRRISEGSIKDRRELEMTKRDVAIKFNLNRYIPTSEILKSLPKGLKQDFHTLLTVRPQRSGSGIIVITLFSAPFICPHGTCIFCPGGPKDGTPQSYLPDGPGMKGALSVNFDPFLQARNGIKKFSERGHPVSKVELVLEGGTFIATPLDYQYNFVKGAYEGLNGSRSQTLEEAQTVNETAQSRVVGLTIESKPDWCRPCDIDLMLRYGVTRLEIGVQSLRNDVLKRSNRGHTVEDTVEAFRVARDAGLKVGAHMMPGLPGADYDRDLEDLRRLFEDEAFKPDMVKIYPTVVVKGTALAGMYLAGRYKPYKMETVVELLSEMKRHVPRWVRIMRIQREIPKHELVADSCGESLRERVRRRALEKGIRCKCIRCREVALSEPQSVPEKFTFRQEEYVASGGTELFCSYESESSEKIAGFIRMRYPSDNAHRLEVRGACIIRELRVYGRSVPIGVRSDLAWQHKGIGSRLLKLMEEVAVSKFGARKMVITSAVGTREYYRRLGYSRDGPYMSKKLN
jgi:elongator complex protein 3